MESSLFITDIQHFSIHDGPGIRTTVFTKGCPLSCRWCHNPEAISPDASILFHSNLCTCCGDCIEICPESCFELEDDLLLFSRDSCTACGLCTEACFHGALELKGMQISISELVQECLLDRKFYGDNGGVTISGGEPLFNQDAVFELFEALKKEQIHLVLDTCGSVHFSLLEKAATYADLFYFDCKCFDSKLHKAWTGTSNELILDNLSRLLQADTPMVVRIPVIPGFNDTSDEMGSIAALLKPFSGSTKVHLLPYHRMGSNKYRALDREYTLKDLKPPDNDNTDRLAALFRDAGVPVQSFHM